MHGQGFACVEFNEDEALPTGALPMDFRLDAMKERLLELEDLFYVHADDERLGRGNGGIGEDDVFKLIGTGRKDRGTFVDFSGIEQVEDRKVLNLKYLVHAFEAESAFAVEEV